jgi:hypothetical protein
MEKKEVGIECLNILDPMVKKHRNYKINFLEGLHKQIQKFNERE